MHIRNDQLAVKIHYVAASWSFVMHDSSFKMSVIGIILLLRRETNGIA